MLSIFSCVCWPLGCFFGEISLHVFCPYFNWIICVFWACCRSSLHILDTNAVMSLMFISLAQTSRSKFTNWAAYLTSQPECFIGISNTTGLHRALDFPFPHLPPPTLAILASGTTLNQWLNLKAKESTFMLLFPLPLTSSPSPNLVYSTLHCILNWPTFFAF